AGGMNRVLANVSPPPLTVVVSGQGEFLARRALGHVGLHCKVVSLAERLGPLASRCATAHALATLAGEV
ncbi:MAG: hypothetical protein KDA41_05100, partial [Planctomycetales bacterium]|nr:hypothetical protein [Planctomycetales bacterium]